MIRRDSISLAHPFPRTVVILIAVSSFVLLFGCRQHVAYGKKYRDSCEQGAPEYRVAIHALDEYEEQLASAKGAGAMRDLMGHFAKLRSHSCFVQSFEESSSFYTLSQSAFQNWWYGGGRQWLESYLGGGDVVVIPPDLPQSLLDDEGDLELSPYMREFLCHPGDEACGEESIRFRERFDQFARFVAVPGTLCESPESPSSYSQFRERTSCEVRRQPRVPIGEVRVPSDGWVCIRMSGVLSAYDLSTGAGYLVEADRGDASSGRPTRTGKLPIELAKQILWNLAVARFVYLGNPRTTVVDLPSGLSKEIIHVIQGGVKGFEYIGSPHDEQLSWRWSDGQREVEETIILHDKDVRFAYLWSLLDSLAIVLSDSGPEPDREIESSRGTHPTGSRVEERDGKVNSQCE